MNTLELKAAMVSKARHVGRSEIRAGGVIYVVRFSSGRSSFYADVAVSEDQFTESLRERIVTHPAATLAAYKELQQ